MIVRRKRDRRTKTHICKSEKEIDFYIGQNDENNGQYTTVIRNIDRHQGNFDGNTFPTTNDCSMFTSTITSYFVHTQGVSNARRLLKMSGLVFLIN